MLCGGVKNTIANAKSKQYSDILEAEKCHVQIDLNTTSR